MITCLATTCFEWNSTNLRLLSHNWSYFIEKRIFFQWYPWYSFFSKQNIFAFVHWCTSSFHLTLSKLTITIYFVYLAYFCVPRISFRTLCSSKKPLIWAVLIEEGNVLPLVCVWCLAFCYFTQTFCSFLIIALRIMYVHRAGALGRESGWET